MAENDQEREIFEKIRRSFGEMALNQWGIYSPQPTPEPITTASAASNVAPEALTAEHLKALYDKYFVIYSAERGDMADKVLIYKGKEHFGVIDQIIKVADGYLVRLRDESFLSEDDAVLMIAKRPKFTFDIRLPQTWLSDWMKNIPTNS